MVTIAITPLAWEPLGSATAMVMVIKVMMKIPSISPFVRTAFCLSCVVPVIATSSLTARAQDATPAASVTDMPSPSNTQARQPQATPAAAGETKQEERLVSLVLLLSTPRKPSHEAIAHAVGEGLGVKVSKDAVVSKPPYHLVNAGADKFIINDIGQPYFEQNAKVADEIKNPNLSRAVRDHRAWISVDWISADQQTDLRKVYQMIGKMVAHLSAKDTLAVYSPDMDQFALWAPTVRQGLESDDPLGVFESTETNQPTQPAPSAPSATPPQ